MSLPLVNRLCIREGFCIAVLNPPLGYSQVLGELPDNVTVANSLEGKFDLIQFFVIKRRKLERELPQLKAALRDDGLLWVSYPKGNRLEADINRDSIAAYAKLTGLKAVAQVSVNKTWSALRFQLVDQYTGHRMTVDVYGHLVPGANRQAVNKLPSLDASDPIELPLKVQQ